MWISDCSSPLSSSCLLKVAYRTSSKWWLPGITSWPSIRTLWPSWSSRITTDSPQSPNSNQRTLTMSNRSSQTVCTCRTQTSPLRDSEYMGRRGKFTNRFLSSIRHPKLSVFHYSWVTILSHWVVDPWGEGVPSPSVSVWLFSSSPPCSNSVLCCTLSARGLSSMQGAIPSSHIPLWAQDLRLLPRLTLHLCFDTGLSDTRVTRTLCQ